MDLDRVPRAPTSAPVQQFGRRGHEVKALRGLAGDVTATRLREAQVTPAAFHAVVDGLADKNLRVRWWCTRCSIMFPTRVPSRQSRASLMTRYREYVAARNMRSGVWRARVERCQASAGHWEVNRPRCPGPEHEGSRRGRVGARLQGLSPTVQRYPTSGDYPRTLSRGKVRIPMRGFCRWRWSG
jgi:hypothetical protein